MRFGLTPEEESAQLQAWLDQQQAAADAAADAQRPYYAQPGWWADTVIRSALAPAPQPQQIVVVEEDVSSLWAIGLGVLGVVVVIKALQ